MKKSKEERQEEADISADVSETGRVQVPTNIRRRLQIWDGADLKLHLKVVRRYGEK